MIHPFLLQGTREEIQNAGSAIHNSQVHVVSGGGVYMAIVFSDNRKVAVEILKGALEGTEVTFVEADCL